MFADVIPVDQFDVKELYRSQWKYVQILADNFWKRWRVEFLQTLQVRRKWKDERKNVKSGDIVLLRDKGCHRNEWSTGIVETAFMIDDGKGFFLFFFFCILHFCHTCSLCHVEQIVQFPARDSTQVLLCLFPGVLWL